VSSQNVPLIQFGDCVRAIASTGLDLVGFEDLEDAGLRALAGFDSIVSWYGTNRPDFREAVADLPFVFHPALPADRSQHAVDFYLSQVGGPVGAVPRIAYPREKGEFIAMHPFSGSASKNWPLENFHALAGMFDIPVHFCHDRFETLDQLAAWLACARVFVGNDSGITHLAAAVGTPVVAIFRTTDPAVWAPRGSDVVVLQDPDVDEVRRAVETVCEKFNSGHG
jgi:hypothetical protein